MSQYTQNQENEILEKFTGFLGFLGLSEPNMDKSKSEKMIFTFTDKDVHKYWVAFYTAYAFGYRHGRIYQANADSILMTQQIHELEQGK